MTQLANWRRFYRIRSEASFNAATPAGGAEWNIGGNGGGANGWMDLPVPIDFDGLQPKSTIIDPRVQAGVRAMNTADPIAGAYPVELGSLPLYFYPELVDRVLLAAWGSVNRVETAGAAAKSSVAFGSLATLDTQPNGTEQLKFTIASSTAATNAAINIIQSTVTQETITIGSNAGTVNGVYYSKGAYNGSTNAITFTVAGTVTDGMVVVAGVDKVTNAFSQGATNGSLVIEQGGRIEGGGTDSEYLNGVIVPSLQLTFDRSAADNQLMLEAPLQGLYGGIATAHTFANDVAKYYRPLATWTGAATIDDVATAEIVSGNITIGPNTELLQTMTGSQNPSGKMEGPFEMFGDLVLIPDGNTRWTDYRDSVPRSLKLTFTSPYMIVDTTPYTVTLTMSRAFLYDYTRTQQGVAQGASITFRGIYNATDVGSGKMTTVCRMPV